MTQTTTRPNTREPRYDREIVTYTALSTFRNCRKRFDYRYNQKLSPVDTAPPLHYGTVWHLLMENLYRLQQKGDRDRESALALARLIDEGYPLRESDPLQKQQWHHLHAMYVCYLEAFEAQDAEWEIIAVEQEFEAPMLGPVKKGRSGRYVSNARWWMRGKADGVVKWNGQFWLLEHKTASTLNGDYIERLPLDTQIQLYCRFLNKAYDWPISGVLYNVAVKSTMKQKEGETEEEYLARKAELEAQSKTGKPSKAQRKMPETDEEYRIRLLTKYREDGMFHRQELFIAPDDLVQLEDEMTELRQALQSAKKRQVYYRNTDHCYQIGRKCPYVALCRSKEDPFIKEKFFTVQDNAHPELSVPDDSTEAAF